MALLLRGRGIVRVRPLKGGFHGWQKLGYPLVALVQAIKTERRP